MNDSLHEALRRAADDTGLVFDATGQDLLRRARRRSRRRLVTAVAAVMLVVGAAGTATAVLPGLLMGQAPPAVRPPTVQPPGAAKILAECPTTIRFPHGFPHEVVFGPRASVITADVSKAGTSAFILSSDRQFYLACTHGPRGGSGFPQVYDVQAPPNGGGMLTVGRRHGRGWFTYCDRFPAEVARVRLDLAGAGHVSAPAVDGFVAFNRWRSVGPRGLTNITLYDRHGNVLASAKRGGLPPEYDSLLPVPRGG